MTDQTHKTPSGRNYLGRADREAILREYHLEGKNQVELAKKYDVSYQQVHRILLKFAAANDKSVLLMKNKPKDNQAEELKALQEEVLSLKKQLYDEQMRADFFETMVDVAEETFNIEIRKKAGTGQSKGCTEKKDTQ